MQALRFSPRLIPTLGSLCLLVLFLYLGQWQSGKGERLAAQRAHFEQRGKQQALIMSGTLVDPQTWSDRPIQVRGQFDAAQQFFLDNRQENGVAGLHVVTPLKIEGSETRVLVNRGWVAWPHGRQTLPTVAVPQGVVDVSGVGAVPSGKKFWLMPERAEAWPELWSRLDLAKYEKQSRHVVQPVVILQAPPPIADGLLHRWDPPEDRVAMHQGYAMQWFGMAFALVMFYFYASVQRTGRPSAPGES